MQNLIINRPTSRQEPPAKECHRWQVAARTIMKDWKFHPYLRVSVTGKCNMRCKFCHNDGSPKHSTGLPVAAYESLAHQAARIGLRAVKLSGGEPTLRKDLPEIVTVFRSAGFSDISMITNGIALIPELQEALKDAGLQRVTVSLHTLQPETYEQNMRIPAVALQQTLVNLDYASSVFAGGLKLNTVFQPGGNYPGEVERLVTLTCYLKATLSVLSEVSNGARTPLISHGVREMVRQSFHVQEIRSEHKRGTKVDTLILREGGAVELDDFRTEEGMAAKDSNTYCAACRLKDCCTEGPYAMRITANGFFKPCLIRRDNEVAI